MDRLLAAARSVLFVAAAFGRFSAYVFAVDGKSGKLLWYVHCLCVRSLHGGIRQLPTDSRPMGFTLVQCHL